MSRTNLDSTNYKLALKSALYDFQSARDFYREACLSSSTPMSRPLILRYTSLQALLIAPIAPHWAEHIWLEVLKNPDTIQRAQWPSDVPNPDPALTAAREYVKTTSSNITSAEAQAAKKMAKGKAAAFDPRKPKRLTIFAASNFPAWQEKYIKLMREMFDATTLSVNDKELKGKVSKMGEVKKAMPFVQALKSRLVGQREDPKTVFDRKLAFDEVEMLENMKKGLMKTTGCKEVVVVKVEDATRQGLPSMAENALPGSPSFLFENVEA
jgi:leucyl-tRNA synthetase